MLASFNIRKMVVRVTGVAVSLIGCASAALAFLAAGCAAPVDTSKAYSRSVIQSGGIVQTDELRVAEYLNYYEQKFPEPVNTAVGLDTRVGNWQAPLGESDAWVQIGLQAKSAKPKEIAPLNLALVIDTSGSMDTSDKMPFVKQSLRVFMQSLAANDRVSVVRYDDEARVVVPSREAGDGQWIDRAIQELEPGGSTNLHAGLIAGLQEVHRHFDPLRNNAVILLSDGIANVGVVDPAQIGAAARSYTESGINLSTIGLGGDFNDVLLSELAKQGQGAYHFIDSGEEMDKVFRRDALGLMVKVATDVSITLRPEEGVELLNITGQLATPPPGPVTIPMRDMGVGDSQVLLARVRLIGREGGATRFPLEVELRYTDAKSSQPETLSSRVQVAVSQLDTYDPLADQEVLRNATIQRSAEGLKEIARLYDAQRYGDAYALASQLERDLRRVAALTGEEQMVKDADMMASYQDTLRKRLPSGEEPEGQATRAPRAAPTRFMRGMPTPAVIEVQ
jgi:Ca-activated chloride channel family protein